MNIAIIILSYNNLEATTRPCVESVLRVSRRSACEVIVVDNASSDGTREYLREAKKRSKNLHLILNDANIGYAAGNNKGIKFTPAEYYVLLNSDTIVTDGWIERMVEYLERHKDVGMAGPVTNSVGNNQMIFTSGRHEDQIIRQGLEWTARCGGDSYHTPILGFFCVAIRRKLIDKIGHLDEGFGVGMYEDDDYCLRAARAGFKMACVEDTFIYHKGSVSFKSSKDILLSELMARNQARYEQKHGVKWTSKFTPACFIEQVEGYLSRCQDDAEKLAYKVANKLQLLKKFQYHPRSFDLEAAQQELEQIKNSTTWRAASFVRRSLVSVPLVHYAWRKARNRAKTILQ